jgi:hypothetical protein
LKFGEIIRRGRFDVKTEEEEEDLNWAFQGEKEIIKN